MANLKLGITSQQHSVEKLFTSHWTFIWDHISWWQVCSSRSAASVVPPTINFSQSGGARKNMIFVGNKVSKAKQNNEKMCVVYIQCVCVQWKELYKISHFSKDFILYFILYYPFIYCKTNNEILFMILHPIS